MTAQACCHHHQTPFPLFHVEDFHWLYRTPGWSQSQLWWRRLQSLYSFASPLFKFQWDPNWKTKKAKLNFNLIKGKAKEKLLWALQLALSVPTTATSTFSRQCRVFINLLAEGRRWLTSKVFSYPFFMSKIK